MTDTAPTELDPILVVGQRRQPSGQFPSRGGGGPAGGGEGGIGVDEPIPEDPTSQPTGRPDPCAAPDTALEWNADAAAAEAAKEFARLASEKTPPETLNTREWGCYLYRASDGSIRMGPPTFGDPFEAGHVGNVQLSNDGIDPATIIGSVHSHGSGSHLPSTGPGARLGRSWRYRSHREPEDLRERERRQWRRGADVHRGPESRPRRLHSVQPD